MNPIIEIEDDDYIYKVDLGEIYDKKNKRNVKGYDNSLGYLKVKVRGVKDYIHRVIYRIYHNITIPNKYVIHHINENPYDNRISNLELLSNQKNLQATSKLRKNNKSGFKGVSKKGKRWVAYITAYNRRKYLGAYDTPEEASDAYKKEADRLNEDGHYYYY